MCLPRLVFREIKPCPARAGDKAAAAPRRYITRAKEKDARLRAPRREEKLLHALFVGLNHLLDHLAADGACLTGSQVAVVALLEVYTDLLWCGITTKIAMILRIMYTNLLVS